MAYDPAARAVEIDQDPNDPRTYPDAGLRAALLLGALFVVVFIVAVIGLLSQRSNTAIGPSTTQSAPNTGAAR